MKIKFLHSLFFISHYPRLDTLVLLLYKPILRIPGFYVCAFCSLRDYKLKIVWSIPKYFRIRELRRIIPLKYHTRQVAAAIKSSLTNARYGAGNIDIC